jgi:RNA polymerase sigma factor (sigma-70 family)
MSEHMQPSDERLLQACQRGDETAWEALVERYQKLIYTIPRRAGLDEDHAAEVFQEVFTTLLEKLDRIEQPERLQAWLVTTARRKTWRIITRDKMTRSRMTDDEESDDEMEALPSHAPLPDTVLLRLEEQQRVRKGVAALDERCRKLLTLLFYVAEPPPYAEIAEALVASEGSIGPTRARCLQKLLRLLE